MKKNDTKDYADLLRQLETKRLTKGTKSVKILVMLKMGNGGGRGRAVCERKGQERGVTRERMGLKDKQGKREWRMKKGELENNKEKKKWEIEVDM